MAERTKDAGDGPGSSGRGRRPRNWRRDLERADRRTRALVREQPILVATAAIVAGYFLGRLVRS